MKLFLDKKTKKNFRYILIAICILTILLIIYLLPGKTREDKMNSWLADNNFEKIITYALMARHLNDEENSIASISISRLERKINREILKSNPGTKIEIKGLQISTDANSKVSINDPFIYKINKETMFFAKSLLEKLENRIGIQNDSIVDFNISTLTEINPGFYPNKTAEIILSYLNKHNLSALDNSTYNEILNLVHFLSSRNELDFNQRLFKINGSNINIRTGPGKENKLLTKANGINAQNDLVIVIDSESRQENIGDKTGNWQKIFITASRQSGWIFSPFLGKSSFDPELADKVIQKYSTSGITIIDFNAWNPAMPPAGFSGKYTKMDIIPVEGDTGIILNSTAGNQTKPITEICRNISGKISEVSFLFSHMEGKKNIRLFSIVNETNQSFLVDVDKEGIYLNNNKYILDTSAAKTLLTLTIDQSNSRGSLTYNGGIILGNINPLSQSQTNGTDSNKWKICLFDGDKNIDSKAILYSFKIKAL